ncbi:MAG: hypothetical protein ACOCX4_03685 [Planctomycetota bacterium]
MPSTPSKSAKSGIDDATVRRGLDALRKLYPDALSDRLSSVEEMLLAVFVDDGNDADAARDALVRVRDAFVNWNEARVARLAEVARLIEPLPNADELAKRVRELLGRIFDRTGSVRLDYLGTMKMSEARRALIEIEPVSRAVADRVLMREVDGANLPFSTEATALAKRAQWIPKSGNRQHLNKLLAESLNREEALDFYFLLEHHAVENPPKTKDPLCK